MLLLHGVLDSNNPLSTFMDLKRAGGDMEENVLSEREIMNMRIRADVALLSDCETARGKYRFGEGMIGMKPGFSDRRHPDHGSQSMESGFRQHQPADGCLPQEPEVASPILRESGGSAHRGPGAT